MLYIKSVTIVAAYAMQTQYKSKTYNAQDENNWK